MEKIRLQVWNKGENEVIGFARLPDQVHRRAVKRGFEFSLMVVGESGLGKSTLVNTLFLAELYKGSDIHERLSKTVEIEVKQIDLTEGGVKVRLNIVDTPGFGDSINSEECWEPIIKYIEHQYEQYFQAESGVNRKHIPDMRVHCCLYFISPYGHGLKQMDIDMMKRLHNKVNLIPLIAKADILTPKEVKNLKLKILEEIAAHHINIYQMAQFDSEDEDYDFKEEDNELRAAIPFAVVGCNSVVEAGGKKIRGRTYPWGIVEVDNPNHCDFSKLKKTISTHMQYLKDMTSEVLYENYRAEHLNCQEVGLKIAESKSSQMEIMLQQKDEEIRKMQILLSNLQNQMSEKLENDSSSNAKLQSSSEDNVDA